MTYVAGVGTAYAEDGRAESLEQIVFRATACALSDAGIGRDQVDSLSLACSDQLDGRAISSMLLVGPAGGYLVDEARCTEGGALALAMAACRVRAEVSEWALAVSWTKSTESPALAAIGVNSEPIFTRPAGLHPLALEAMEVQRFLHSSGGDVALFDTLARQRRDVAGRAMPDIDVSAPLAVPLKVGHVPRRDDVAVAVVLTSHPHAVRLAGMAHGVEHPEPVARRGRPGSLLSVKARQAYAMADVEPGACEVIETTDHNVFRLAMAVAGLGLVDEADSAVRLLGGDLCHVNSAGGLWARNAVLAAGLDVTVRGYERLRRGGGSAICHSSYGSAGQGQAVWVMKTEAQ